mmetsp:Transcript_44418/g.102648  ORF Transcript_44418/g.102648 Transcript_44418/m.102648 type:complete len:202 (-) Transcript_44418:897-1502(-)
MRPHGSCNGLLAARAKTPQDGLLLETAARHLRLGPAGPAALTSRVATLRVCQQRELALMANQADRARFAFTWCPQQEPAGCAVQARHLGIGLLNKAHNCRRPCRGMAPDALRHHLAALRLEAAWLERLCGGAMRELPLCPRTPAIFASGVPAPRVLKERQALPLAHRARRAVLRRIRRAPECLSCRVLEPRHLFVNVGSKR